MTEKEKGRKIMETPYGKLPVGTPRKNGCEAWQRALCLENRIDNDPESMVVEGRPDILQCPVCAHIITLEVALND